MDTKTSIEKLERIQKNVIRVHNVLLIINIAALILSVLVFNSQYAWEITFVALCEMLLFDIVFTHVHNKIFKQQVLKAAETEVINRK